MPFPKSPVALLHPERKLPFENWAEVYAPYCFVHTAGLRDLCLEAGITTAKTLKRYRAAAIEAQPKSWREAWREGDWKQLSSPQIDRAFKRKPMSFDKAALSLVAVEQALQKEPLAEGVNRDAALKILYDEITLAPAIYVVSGFDRSAYDALSPGDLDHLKGQTLQIQNGALLDASNGQPVTHYFADRLAAAWTARSGTPATVQIVYARTDLPRRQKHANKREFVSMELARRLRGGKA